MSFYTYKVTENQWDSRFYYVIYFYLIYSFSETYHVFFLPQFLLAFGWKLHKLRKFNGLLYKIIFSYLLPCHLYDANLPGRLEFSEWKNQQAPHTVFLWSYSKDAYDVYSMGRKIVAHSPAPSKCSKTAMSRTRSTRITEAITWNNK